MREVENCDPVQHALDLGYGIDEIRKLLEEGISSEELFAIKTPSVTAINFLNNAPALVISKSLKPEDFTDAGNAKLFSEICSGQVIFVLSRGWAVWDSLRFVFNELFVLSLALQFSEQMLLEATAELFDSRKKQTIAETSGDRVSIALASKAVTEAKTFHRHAMLTREATRISRFLDLARAYLYIDADQLDHDAFLLNTPSGIVDLRTGGLKPHTPVALCSKITAIGPGKRGKHLWLEFLHRITGGDAQLEYFLQLIVGMSAVGSVFQESLIVAFGVGGNGKSSFFNSCLAALGDYSGSIDPEVLLVGKQNKAHDLAELRGKRLVIAAELEEGRRLSASMLKRLVSTDLISAERKYLDPEFFRPTHSLILFTNHMPKIGSCDYGTWRRIVLVPFSANLTGTGEIKNYADFLVKEAGESIIQWIIDGAKAFIDNGCNLLMPDLVINVTKQYERDNDWVQNFLDDCCIIGDGQCAFGGALYTRYRNWSDQNKDFTRSNRAFMDGLILKGFKNHKTKKGSIWDGLSLNSSFGGER